MKRWQKIWALPSPPLIWTKSKRTAVLFCENVPKFTMQMKCPAWFHWRRRRVIARRVIHCPVNWIMQDHAAFFIFHIIIIVIIIISDDSSPLKFTTSSMKPTQGKSLSAKYDTPLLQNVNCARTHTYLFHCLTPYYSPSSDSSFWSNITFDVSMSSLSSNITENTKVPRDQRERQPCELEGKTMLYFEEGLT